MKRLKKVFTTIIATIAMMMLMTVNVLAATDLVKDGKNLVGGFINAGEEVDGTIQGPGNWTQLNMADYTVDAKYLHIVMKATGDTAPAQIVVSDTATFNLKDLGVTLTEEYQDVVLPVQDKGLTMISWVNFTGLDGGSSVYTIKDIFLSDEAASSLAAAPATETTDDAAVTTESVTTDAPKTGESIMPIIMLIVVMACAAVALYQSRKRARA